MPVRDDIQVLPSVRRVQRGRGGVALPDIRKVEADVADTNAKNYLRQVRRLRQQYAGDPARLQHYLGELSRRRDKENPPTGTVVTRRPVFDGSAPLGARPSSAAISGGRLSPAAAISDRGAVSTRAGEDARAPIQTRFSRAVVDWFADHVANQLDERLLHYSKRQALLKTADRLGIGRFHANLIIAVAQHQAGGPMAAHSTPDAGSEVRRRAGSGVKESGSSEYLRTGVLWNGAGEDVSKLYPARDRSNMVLVTIVLVVQTLIVAAVWLMLRA